MTEQELRTVLMHSPKENLRDIHDHTRTPEWQAKRQDFLDGKLSMPPGSGITISEKKIRSFVSNRLKAGDFTTKKASRGDARANMVFDDPIGSAFMFDPDGKPIERNTRILEIVYSKEKGYHFFPVPEEKRRFG